MRRLVAETRIGVDDLIAPIFVREDVDTPQPIVSLPGVMQHSQASLQAEVKELLGLGVSGVILFGLPARKDPVGSEAWNPGGVVQVALRNLREAHGDELVIMADLCVDEYTDHGHCGIVTPDGVVDNDATLELYQKAALAQAEAGAHMVAPSGMMDGQVAAIRQALDANGHDSIPIMAYSAKYASAEYGPFRDAVDVTIAGGGDRKGYQQDPANAREAMEEIRCRLCRMILNSDFDSIQNHLAAGTAVGMGYRGQAGSMQPDNLFCDLLGIALHVTLGGPVPVPGPADGRSA